MENRNINSSEGYMFFFFESTSPLYLDKRSLLDIIKDFPNFEINNKNCEEFYDSLESFIDKYNNVKKTFLVIDTNDIDLSVQSRLVALVKARTYKTLDLPQNCKIIVIGNPNNMNKELFGLLVAVDV